MDVTAMLAAYRLMLLSRAVDNECQRIIADAGDVPNYHSGRGQEAASAGLGLSLGKADYMQYGYRDFAMLLAKGVTLDELAGDLLLRVSGTTAGCGGVMHISKPEVGIVGRNGVFGSRFGIAVGLGLAASRRGAGQIVLCPFGEAEGGRGPLYEAMNFACLRRLPIVFVAQNNGYSISSRTADLYAGGNMSSLWRGFPMPVRSVDGNDVCAVFAAATAARTGARAGLGPSLVEVVSYRIDPHIPAEAAMLGATGYQPAAEIEAWRARDPIDRMRQRLASVAPGTNLQALESETSAEAHAAFSHADAAPNPAPETMYEFIYYRDALTV
jgi:pyruvate dehydrogenase E1 component alpha subunit